MSNQKFGPLFAATGVIFIWSTSFSFSKVAIGDLGVWSFRLYTSLAAFCLVLPYARRAWTGLNRLDPAAKKYLLVSTFLNGAVVPLFNNIALANFSASNVIVLINTMPAFMTVLEFLWSPNRRIFSLVPAALTGVGIIMFSGLSGLRSGEILILANAFVWALATLFSGQKFSASDRFTKTFWQTAISLVTALFFNLTSFIFLNKGLSIPNEFDIFSVLYSGILNGAVVFFLWYTVIEAYGAGRAAYLTLITPLLGAFFASVYLNENLGVLKVLGVLTIILGLFVKQRLNKVAAV